MVAMAEDFCFSPPPSSDFTGDASSESVFTRSPPVKLEEEEEEDLELLDQKSAIKVKEESLEELDHGGGGDFPAVAARPMEGLHVAGPPPFLNKTYLMVDDSETNSVVSWSRARDSFVVWDAHEFSRILLPKYFKHSNFSSFVRQLNTYGFKKVDPDRWEFANEGFQGGKKHLLKNIKRRSKYNTNQQQQQRQQQGKVSASGLETELDGLKQDHDSLRIEITKLRQEQNESRRQIASVEERIRFTECRQRQMLVFLTKTISNPDFIRQLMKRRPKPELDLGLEIRKRKRISLNPGLSSSQVLTGDFSTPTSSESFGTTTASSPSSGYDDVASDDLLNDNFILDSDDDEDEELSVSDSGFYRELEDLMVVEKYRDWGYYGTGLVEQSSML